MENLLIGIIVSLLMVFATSTLFYDIMRIAWVSLPKFKVKPRKRILVIVFGIFTAHTACVWLYGLTYYVMVEYLKIAAFESATKVPFISYIYFSAESYSSLGVSGLSPSDALRFISGVEAINGLVLIGWSVSFTYITMEKFWVIHHKKSDKEDI